MSETGKVFIVSAPSGSGKSTLVADLLSKVPNLAFSISYTTRKPRGNERDGVEYFFISEETFKEMIARKQFIEYARVFDQYYGTSKLVLDQFLAQGKDVLLDVDTEGAYQVKKKLSDAISIFIMPPSYGALKKRLETRQLDSEDTICKRLSWASQVEIHRFKNYDYVVINEDLSATADLMSSIVYAERCRTERMAKRVESIIDTFGGVSVDK